MPIKALNLSVERTYISPSDDPSDCTVFKLRPLTSRDVGQLQDMVTKFVVPTGEGASDEVETSIDRSKMNFEAVRRGLSGWENFVGDDDKPIEFKTLSRRVGDKNRDVIAPDLLEIIPLHIIHELASEILKDNKIEDADLGNSPEPSTDG